MPLNIVSEQTINSNIEMLTNHLNNLLDEMKNEQHEKKIKLIKLQITNVNNQLNCNYKSKQFFQKYNAITE